MKRNGNRHPSALVFRLPSARPIFYSCTIIKIHHNFPNFCSKKKGQKDNHTKKNRQIYLNIQTVPRYEKLFCFILTILSIPCKMNSRKRILFGMPAANHQGRRNLVLLRSITRVALGHILLFTKRKTPSVYEGVFRFFRPFRRILNLEAGRIFRNDLSHWSNTI